jgi:hypothetical protein
VWSAELRAVRRPCDLQATPPCSQLLNGVAVLRAQQRSCEQLSVELRRSGANTAGGAQQSWETRVTGVRRSYVWCVPLLQEEVSVASNGLWWCYQPWPVVLLAMVAVLPSMAEGATSHGRRRYHGLAAMLP